MQVAPTATTSGWVTCVTQHLIKTKKKIKGKIKVVGMMITQRKLFIRDLNPISGSGLYRVVVVTRQGVTTYSLSTLPIIPQCPWSNPNAPSGKFAPWHKVGEDYVKLGKSMEEGEFLSWLSAHIGGRDAAEECLLTLLTAPPTNV